MADCQCIELEARGDVLWIWLNRPEVRNALNPQLIAELTECLLNQASSDQAPRAIVLGGRGPVFCAGADLAYMREIAGFGPEQNREDALRLAALFEALDSCPCPVVCRVQHGGFGGALGLIACCDSVIADEDATFSFPEVRLGIVAATIAPYVLAKIGLSHARDLLLSGERFTAPYATRIGLVHQCVASAALDLAVEAKLAELLMAGPLAARATKQLLQELHGAPSAAVKEQTAALIADMRASAEGQEGLAAALGKRKPAWQPLQISEA